MPIDWFTVTAQALNFGVLVWLLSRFLYGPILKAVDAREKRVADELADAAAQQAQAKQERDALARKNAEFAQQRKALLDKAQAQAAEQREQLLAQARDDASAWTARRLASLTEQAQQLDGAIRKQAQQEVLAIARKALQDLAGADLQERVCETFTRRLRDTDSGARAALAHALKTDDDAILVRSAFALTASMRGAIEKALREVLGSDAPVRFEATPDLVCGIELVGGGQKIGWSIANYLDAMEHRLAQRLREQGDSPTTPVATTS